MTTAAPAHASRYQRARGRAVAAFGLLQAQSIQATRLRRLHQEGCLKLRFPRLPQSEAEAVIINTSGGLTGGDQLSLALDVEAGATLTATTQACERIYRSTGDDATIETSLRVAGRGGLAYLPQETILFDGARLRRRLDVECAADSRLLLVESVLLGRQAMGETVREGALHDRWRVRRDGRLVFADDLRFLSPVDALCGRAATLHGGRAFATILWQTGDEERVLGGLRDILGKGGGASIVGGFGIARLAAADGYELRRRLVPALTLLAHAPLPRLWSL